LDFFVWVAAALVGGNFFFTAFSTGITATINFLHLLMALHLNRHS
jgi:hypothetical protein